MYKYEVVTITKKELHDLAGAIEKETNRRPDARLVHITPNSRPLNKDQGGLTTGYVLTFERES